MGRERCFFCDRYIFDGDDITRPPALGLSVHRHCYLRDAGLESEDDSQHGGQADVEDSASDDPAA